MLSRRTFLLGIGALLGLTELYFDLYATCSANQEQPRRSNDSDFVIPSKEALRNRAERKGLLFGACCLKNHLSNNREFAIHFTQECNILVPGNELKWHDLRPTLYEFNFRSGDWLENFARKNKILVRGHTLVWHEALPAWFPYIVNKGNAGQYLRNHITTVAGHYAGKMHSWDVVNEVISPWDGRPDGLSNTSWLKLLGPAYIDIAFKAAAAADPKALLVLNQNYLEYDAPKWAGFRTATLNLLKRLKSSGTPVHALGIQAHLSSEDGKFNPEIFRAFLNDVASLDLKIMITELDVSDKKLPYDITIRDRIVAGMYEDFLSVVLDEPAIIAVLTWGLSDKYTWYSEYPRADKAAVRPLPLDEKFNRKLAWNAIARAFDNAPKRKS